MAWGQAPEWSGPDLGLRRPGPGDTIPGRTRPRRRWARKLLFRTLAVLGALILLGVVAFGGLLLFTPSAGNAAALAQAQDSSHGVAYPGPAVPTRFADALVATEDHRFYSDPRVDPIAVVRVGWGYLTGSGGLQGGATITQQLAKMLYTPGQSGVRAEAKQVALAVKLNFTYTKPRILQMYADVAYYGQNYYSLGAASCGYFGVPPASLTWPQAAMLAGVVNGPSIYDPLDNPVQAHAREAHVLSRLVATGTLTQPQADTALNQSLGLVPRDEAQTAPGAGATSCGG
jgi:penicillin-binding protein 1A